MPEREIKRERWGSKIGFIIAAAGSAIGLGNIWRFPSATGENGGGAFVFLYIIFIILIGLPVMIAELTIGRNTQKNPVGAFKKLFPRSLWKYFGGFCIFSSTMILSFYAVFAGFALGYFFKIVLQDFSHITTGAQSEQAFALFSENPVISLGLTFVFILITAVIVARGISKGIERWCKVMMPILFFLLIMLVIRSLTLEGAGKGLEFYLKPNFSILTPATFVNALGQALFSLSLGLGTMLTYGSYLSRRENIVTSAASVVFF